MKREFFRLGLLAALVVTIAMALLQPPSSVYPIIEILVPDALHPITIKSVFERQSRVGDCEGLTGNVVRITLERCPECRVVGAQCATRLSEEARQMLGNDPLTLPTGRLANGVMSFASTDPQIAQQACEAAAATTASQPNPITCHHAGVPRPALVQSVALAPKYAALVIVASLTAWVVGWLIIRYEHLHSHLTHDAVDEGPQKSHSRPTPRIGGVQLVAGLLAGWVVLTTFEANPGRDLFGLLLLCGLPAFFGGLVEDVTRKVGVVERLLMTMLSGAAACWLLGAVVHRIDIPLVDSALAWLPLGIVFTSFAVGGIANSINIIDGFHGLAAGVTMITAAALACIAWSVGDTAIFTITLLLLGSLAGFFLWNWPRGLIFLGDGGAYLVGVLLAELSILLVIRHPTISPWFPLLALCHPVVETLFSMVRRYVDPVARIGGPDSEHLHQRVFRRLYGTGRNPVENNHRVAKYFWLTGSITAATAVYFFADPIALGIAFLVYGTLYLVSYRTVVH
jgi:UDP-N-acetylmuramyl pentapeptide phosphotransferase/UDP-N-acetylglucosamine-1-phosphate transferase